MEELKKALDEIFKDDIIKIVISNKLNKEVKYNKIAVNLKETNKGSFYQIEKFTDKQVFHENVNIEIIKEKVYECLNGAYKQLSAWSDNCTYDMKISKKGKVFLGKKKSDNSKVAKKGHNKEKIIY